MAAINAGGVLKSGLAMERQRCIRLSAMLTMKLVIIQMLGRVFILGLPMVCLAASPTTGDTNLDALWKADELRLTELQNSDAGQLDELVARFDQWMQTQDREAFQKLPDEFSSILRWFSSRNKDQEQIANLKAMIKHAESLLQQKQIALTNVQQKIALLKLNPKQLAEVENYNQSLRSEPSSTMEWLRTKSTQYDITKDVVLMLVSFPLGMFAEAARRRWTARRKVSRKME
jgi:hypothetical protein